MNGAVKTFWDEQAKEHGASDLATNPDQHYRTLEIARIMRLMNPDDHVLDVGCGNGFSTLAFAEANPSSTYLGVDYSEGMIAAAATAQGTRRNVMFQVGDVRKLFEALPTGHKFGPPYDTILSERCLINLASWDEQKRAILELKRLMKEDGRLILVENTKEGLANLNRLRKQFDLPEITVRWHNQYLPQEEFNTFAAQHFKIQEVENIGNLYYVISRVLYAKMARMEGKEPDYNHPINQLAAQLPSFPMYRNSPNFLWVLRNK